MGADITVFNAHSEVMCVVLESTGDKQVEPSSLLKLHSGELALCEETSVL
jgi:hypothetical protein